MASPGPPASGEMSLYPNMQAALDEAGKVVKKQKTCAAKTDALLGQLISVVQASQTQLSSDVASTCQCSAIKEFNLKVGNLDLIKELNTQTKEVHTAIGKLGKVWQACAELHYRIHSSAFKVLASSFCRAEAPLSCFRAVTVC